MLAAIEVYNKPQMTYRDEVTVSLVVNAWELALKAALRQKRKNIFYPKKKNEPYKSLALDDCLGRITSLGLWPASIDGIALVANLKALSEYRNRAIHLYNAQGLGAVIYPFLQQNIINYRDFVLERFNKDLADSITWQLLPLGATAPADSVRFLKTNSDAAMITEVQDFIDTLRGYMDEAEAAGSEMSRVATVYDINMRSVKKMTSADLIVAVSTTGDGQVVIKQTDPNQTHPHTMTALIEKINKRRSGRKLTQYDLTTLIWKENLRDNSRFAWKHSLNGTQYFWSGDALSYLASKDDTEYDNARADYQVHLKKRQVK